MTLTMTLQHYFRWPLLGMAAAMLIVSPAAAETLISQDEAKLPSGPAPMTTRGVTRGPSIQTLIPGKTVQSPFEFKVAFEPHGGSKIDPASIKVTYLKSPAVDLTPRLRPYISGTGIDMTAAEIPPGEHSIRIDVKDTEGRASSSIVQLEAPQ